MQAPESEEFTGADHNLLRFFIGKKSFTVAILEQLLGSTVAIFSLMTCTESPVTEQYPEYLVGNVCAELRRNTGYLCKMLHTMYTDSMRFYRLQKAQYQYKQDNILICKSPRTHMSLRNMSCPVAFYIYPKSKYQECKAKSEFTIVPRRSAILVWRI